MKIYIRFSRNYQVDYSRYSFKAEDDWGGYDNGKRVEPVVQKSGYRKNNYWCTDGKRHSMAEHIAKWEYFNGRIPKGLVIDHIIPIRNGGTNKLSNLRLVTPLQNANNELTKKNFSKARKGENNPFYGKHHTEETKRKISEKAKDRPNPFKGKHHTEEAKRKISERLKGKKMSEEFCKQLSERLKGKKQSEEWIRKRSESRKKQVFQYTLGGELVGVYASATDAAKELGLSCGNISSCCNGKLKTYAKHIWRF